MAALQFRKRGWTYQRIADELGYKGPQGAHKAVKSVLDKAEREAANEALELELERLDSMLTGLWPRAKSGVPTAVDRVIRIGEARAKLLGLNAPQEIVVRAVEAGLNEILNTARRVLPQEQFAALAAALAEDGGPEEPAGNVTPLRRRTSAP